MHEPVRTTPFLTKFEYAKLVGMIVLQLSMNKEVKSDANLMEIARSIVLSQKAPIVIRRYMPDGSYEDCSLQKLKLDPLLVMSHV